MVMTQSDVRHANIQINKDKSLKKSRKKNDLAVILLLLSDVRLVSSRQTSLASLSKATSQAMFTLLSHCLLGFSMTILLKLMYILRALDITYSALTRRKTAVSSEA